MPIYQEDLDRTVEEQTGKNLRGLVTEYLALILNGDKNSSPHLKKKDYKPVLVNVRKSSHDGESDIESTWIYRARTIYGKNHKESKIFINGEYKINRRKYLLYGHIYGYDADGKEYYKYDRAECYYTTTNEWNVTYLTSRSVRCSFSCLFQYDFKTNSADEVNRLIDASKIKNKQIKISLDIVTAVIKAKEVDLLNQLLQECGKKFKENEIKYSKHVNYLIAAIQSNNPMILKKIVQHYGVDSFKKHKDHIFNEIKKLPEVRVISHFQDCLNHKTDLGQIMFCSRYIFKSASVESGTLKKIKDYLIIHGVPSNMFQKEESRTKIAVTIFDTLFSVKPSENKKEISLINPSAISDELQKEMNQEHDGIYKL